MTTTTISNNNLIVRRKSVSFVPNAQRVIARLFIPGEKKRLNRIITKIVALPQSRIEEILRHVLHDFSSRHRNFEDILLDHFCQVKRQADVPDGLSKEMNLLIGAYFTSEYSIESAALFNPSIVADPDQNDLDPGCLRTVISFRATGEGHVSSIEFRRVIRRITK